MHTRASFFYYYHRLKNNKALIGIVRSPRTVRVGPPHHPCSCPAPIL